MSDPKDRYREKALEMWAQGVAKSRYEGRKVDVSTGILRITSDVTSRHGAQTDDHLFTRQALRSGIGHRLEIESSIKNALSSDMFTKETPVIITLIVGMGDLDVSSTDFDRASSALMAMRRVVEYDPDDVGGDPRARPHILDMLPLELYCFKKNRSVSFTIVHLRPSEVPEADLIDHYDFTAFGAGNDVTGPLMRQLREMTRLPVRESRQVSTIVPYIWRGLRIDYTSNNKSLGRSSFENPELQKIVDMHVGSDLQQVKLQLSQGERAAGRSTKHLVVGDST
jgi:hypothetical protein